MIQTVQEVKEITCYAKCPICGMKDAFEMPDDLGAKEINQVCADCKTRLDIYVCAPRNVSTARYSHACVFLCGLCDEGNINAIALVKDLVNGK